MVEIYVVEQKVVMVESASGLILYVKSEIIKLV